MRSVKGAAIALILLTVTVLFNSLYIGKICRDLKSDIESVNGTDAELLCKEYEKIFERFKKAERIISLTVSHDDLTNIESEFCEIIGAIEAADEEGLIIAKSRLVGALRHLGRLSGINADSIF